MNVVGGIIAILAPRAGKVQAGTAFPKAHFPGPQKQLLLPNRLTLEYFQMNVLSRHTYC